MLNTKRAWDVLLIGGASGSGKTSVSRPLARHYGVDLVRVDDFQVLLDTLTTPECLPALHYWKTHPRWADEGVDAAVSRLIDAGQALTPGLAAVIRDHLDENIPMVLEGDFILPALAAAVAQPKVKSVFLFEPEQEQLLLNYQAREGTLQPYRAAVSHVYGCWLADEAAARGLAAVPSRPWDTLMERVMDCCR